MRKIVLVSIILILITIILVCDNEDNIPQEPLEGSVWIDVAGEDYYNGPVVKYDASDGRALLKFGDFYATRMDVCEKDDCVWIGDGEELHKYSSQGNELIYKNLNGNILNLKVNDNTGNCWIYIYESGLQKLSETDGNVLCEYDGINGYNIHLFINSTDGSCYVADEDNGRIIKLSSECEVLFESEDIIKPISICVDPRDGSCWVGDEENYETVKLSSEGDFILSIDEAANISRVNSNTGDLYIGVLGFDVVHRYSSSGEDLGYFVNSGSGVCGLTINTYDNTIWVAFDWHSEIYKLSQDLEILLEKEMRMMMSSSTIYVNSGAGQ